MTSLALHLDRSAPAPLGVQLADAVRDRVTDGRLRPGERLPSSRALAVELGVARSVVEQAWAQLVAEGWLEGRHGSGTFVAAGRSAGAAPRPRRPGPAPGFTVSKNHAPLSKSAMTRPQPRKPSSTSPLLSGWA